MIEELLSAEAQKLISDNSKRSPAEFVLENAGSGLPINEIATQIKGRQKNAKKLTGILSNRAFLFPSSKSAEQSSSELTANYKSSLCKGRKAVDLTGGLGVDAYYLAKSFSSVDYVEADPKLCEYAKHNFAALGASNISVICSDAESYLDQLDQEVDMIYMDPDRRNEKGRVLSVSDCSPNAEKLLPRIEQLAKNWMVKLSPMLDISMGKKSFKNANYIGLISVANDLKELIFANIQVKDEDRYHCIDFVKGEKREHAFPFTSEDQETYNMPLDYIYEPSVSILKLGKKAVLSSRFPVFQLNPNSNLFTSTEIIEDFPGRGYKVIDQVKPQRKKVTQYLKGRGARLISRNFPMAADQIRTKWRIKEGGELVLFFTKLTDDSYSTLIAREIV